MLKNAKWIRCAKEENSPTLFKKISVTSEVEKAVLSITSAGVYEARLNGNRVGNFFLAPVGIRVISVGDQLQKTMLFYFWQNWKLPQRTQRCRKLLPTLLG